MCTLKREPKLHAGHPGKTNTESYTETHQKIEGLLIKNSKKIRIQNTEKSQGISERELAAQARIISNNTVRKHLYGNGLSGKKHRHGFSELGLAEKRNGKWFWVAEARRIKSIERMFRFFLGSLEDKKAEEIEDYLNDRVLIFKPCNSGNKPKYDLITMPVKITASAKEFVDHVYETLLANMRNPKNE
jgi:hypothetical protein